MIHSGFGGLPSSSFGSGPSSSFGSVFDLISSVDSVLGPSVEGLGSIVGFTLSVMSGPGILVDLGSSVYSGFSTPGVDGLFVGLVPPVILGLGLGLPVGLGPSVLLGLGLGLPVGLGPSVLLGLGLGLLVGLGLGLPVGLGPSVLLGLGLGLLVGLGPSVLLGLAVAVLGGGLGWPGHPI